LRALRSVEVLGLDVTLKLKTCNILESGLEGDLDLKAMLT
jgi:hypothetical protein